MKIIFAIFFVLVLISCGSNNEETLAYDQLSPNAKQKNYVDSAAVKVEGKPTESVFIPIVDSLFDAKTWQKWDTVLFIDRFGALSSEKWITKTDKDSTVLIHLEYADSNRTKNAFYNWLDCFGPTCTTCQFGGNMKVKQRNALILVGEKGLYYFDSPSLLDEAAIRSIIEPKEKKQNWLYVVAIPKKGKTSWKRIVKGEEKPIIIDENR